MPAVCKFFLQGRCKFGDRCKNAHPRNNGGGGGGGGGGGHNNRNNNRVRVLA